MNAGDHVAAILTDPTRDAMITDRRTVNRGGGPPRAPRRVALARGAGTRATSCSPGRTAVRARSRPRGHTASDSRLPNTGTADSCAVAHALDGKTHVHWDALL